MKAQGRILNLSGGLYTVKTEKESVLCFAKGSFRRSGISPVAGDLVRIDTEEKIGNKELEKGARGVITEILARKNVLIRPPLANLDTLFLVAAVKDPEPVLLSIDKLLAITRHNDIETVLVFTKKELDPNRAEELCTLYRKAGFAAFAVSKLEADETRALLYPCIKGTICALAGASGVGKSTLINTLFPFLATQTGDLSEKTQRGKHTTRQSTLYGISDLLGREDDVYVADTPGFSLLDFDRFFFMEKEDLAFAFPEFEPLLGSCKYTKCSHQTEDGCRILAEVENGNIAKSRHESYLTLLRELNKTKSWELDKKKTHR
ncbi:MAG: ribosome small subunit-dependent GTPase A [Ruminococcaceae bacterium]|nr:ribosome small subunit-dependent GTPase A [Oscillospiraceae bacterium]